MLMIIIIIMIIVTLILLIISITNITFRTVIWEGCVAMLDNFPVGSITSTLCVVMREMYWDVRSSITDRA